MATHASILAWRIRWTEEPGGLQSMGSQSWTQLNYLACTQTFQGKNDRNWFNVRSKEMYHK